MNYFDSAQDLFNVRHEEMKDFLLNFLGIFNSENSNISRESEHIIKSNITLMQYNVLESSFLELYKNLYNYLKTCRISIDLANNKFSYNTFSLIKRASQQKHEAIRAKILNNSQNLNFSNCAMSICFELDDEEQKFLVNGNLDGRKIKEFLDNLGADISQLEQLDLKELKILKDNRQLLAHGGESFSTVGKGLSWDTLVRNIDTLDILFTTSKEILINFCNDISQQNVA